MPRGRPVGATDKSPRRGYVKRGVALPQLAAWRDYRMLSQVDLAHRADISRATISRAERQGATVSYSSIAKLAKALHVLPEDLNDTPPYKHAPQLHKKESA